MRRYCGQKAVLLGGDNEDRTWRLGVYYGVSIDPI